MKSKKLYLIRKERYVEDWCISYIHPRSGTLLSSGILVYDGEVRLG